MFVHGGVKSLTLMWKCKKWDILSYSPYYPDIDPAIVSAKLGISASGSWLAHVPTMTIACHGGDSQTLSVPYHPEGDRFVVLVTSLGGCQYPDDD
ncbi:hypothetical protein GWI33_011920 [Rhynchophorus ferrugineus]|uniref:Uncharacterized protein n=1 Tax=Rhynchophorus ferrugineus TaxID=354439 RepID=A0A834IPR3_RHYFE|nr:hypothetical protein GWI33_011920 [Rhynchophorus ferrugineus]